LPKLRRKNIRLAEKYTNSAGIRLSSKKIGGGAARVNKIRRGGGRRRRKGLCGPHLKSECTEYRLILTWKIHEIPV